MSREQLVDAYLRGDISRRIFIRRLVAAGVSLSAAVGYAHLLTPAPAQAARVKAAADLYQHLPPPDKTPPSLTLTIPPRSMGRLLKSKRIRVQVGASEAASVTITAVTTLRKLKRNGKHGPPRQLTLVTQQLALAKGPPQIVSLKLSRAGRRAMRGHDKVRVIVLVEAADKAGNRSSVSSKRAFKR